MLFLSLLLLGQSLVPDPDTGKAARQCAVVLQMDYVNHGSDGLRSMSAMVYLSLIAAKADSDDRETFLRRFAAILVEGKNEIMASKDHGILPASCITRFPLARMARPATLPQISADRDILCYYAFDMLGTIAEDFAPAKTAELAQGRERFASRLNAALTAKGLTEAAIQNRTAQSEALLGSIEFGNLYMIYKACKKLPA